MADRRDVLLKEYGEVASNFRALADIRFKLLTFLPIGSGLAASLGLFSQSLGNTLVLGLFFLAVTIGLITYNSRNDQLYDDLVERCASIERELGVRDGAFANRPRSWFKFVWKVDHRFALALIYSASSALWLSIVFNSTARLILGSRAVGDLVTVVTFGMSVAVTAVVLTGTVRYRQRMEDRLRWDAREVVAKLFGLLKQKDLPKLEELPVDLKDSLLRLGGPSIEPHLGARFKFLHDRFDPGREISLWDVAQIIADLTDLRPQWLYDCATQRRRNVAKPGE